MIQTFQNILFLIKKLQSNNNNKQQAVSHRSLHFEIWNLKNYNKIHN